MLYKYLCGDHLSFRLFYSTVSTNLSGSALLLRQLITCDIRHIRFSVHFSLKGWYWFVNEFPIISDVR